MIILIIGLPNAGKTTLAKELVSAFSAVHWNADEVRKTLNAHLGFSLEDRIEQAKRMRFLCDVVVKSGQYVIADFVCPTNETRGAFGDAYTIWVDRISKEESRFEDTRNLFVTPLRYDFRYTKESTVEEVIDHIRKTKESQK